MQATSKNPVKLIARAAEFAWRQRVHEAAAGNASAISCYGKVSTIARLVAELTDGRDQFVVAAAWLHHLIGETSCTRIDIEQRFGHEIARVLTEIAMDQTLSKSQRRQIELATAGSKTQRAKMIIMAEHAYVIHHLQAPEATELEIQQRLDRLTWSADVVDQCRLAHPPLGNAFDRAYKAAIDNLGLLATKIAGDQGEILRRALVCISKPLAA